MWFSWPETSLSDLVLFQENLIIVDAPNVAMRHGTKKVFSCEGIRITLQYWLDRGFKVVGFLPEYYTDHEYVGKMRNATKLGLVDRPSKIPDNIALIKQLEEQGLLVLTPPQDYDVRARSLPPSFSCNCSVIRLRPHV